MADVMFERKQLDDGVCGIDYDLVIIGGGIVGAGIAWEGAMRGLRVMLLEKNDFASGASSKSSKLLHGGVRYLEQGQFRLVFESLAQRDRLFEDAAHVARRLTYFFPIVRGGYDRGWVVNVGLTLYDCLANFASRGRSGIHRWLNRQAAITAAPALRAERLSGVFAYCDGITDDARLVIETLKSAVACNASAFNYVEVLGVTRPGASGLLHVRVWDHLAGAEKTLRARKVINAAGPWVDAVTRLVLPDAPLHLRPTKGVHVVVNRQLTEQAIVMRSCSPSEREPRVMFVIPWGGRTIIGTTDTDYDGPSGDFHYLDEDVTVSEAEEAYVLDAANQVLNSQLTSQDVIGRFAGWRPLIAPSQAGLGASQVSREHVVFEPLSGFFVIAGGKLTGYRTMACQAIERILGDRKAPPSRIETAPISGSELGGRPFDAFVQECERETRTLPLETVRVLANRYGTNFAQLRDILNENPDWAKPFGGSFIPVYPAELVYSVRHESAYALRDWFERRTRLTILDPAGARTIASSAAQLMANLHQRRLVWSDDTRAQWIESQLADLWASLDGHTAVTPTHGDQR